MRASPRKQCRRVTVEWNDAASHSEWGPVSAARELKAARVVTCGWLIYQDKRKLVIAQSIAEDSDVADVIVIPAPWVIRERKR